MPKGELLREIMGYKLRLAGEDWRDKSSTC